MIELKVEYKNDSVTFFGNLHFLMDKSHIEMVEKIRQTMRNVMIYATNKWLTKEPAMSRRGKFAKVNRAFDQHSIKDFFKAAVKRKAPTDDNTDDPPLKQMAPEVITLDDSPVKPMAARPVSIELQDAADLCTPFAEINNTLNNNAEPSTPVLNNSEELVEFNDDELYAPKQLSNFDFACSTFGASVYAIGPHSELQSALQLPSGHAKKSAILMSVKNIGTSGVRPLKIRAYEYRYWHKKIQGKRPRQDGANSQNDDRIHRTFMHFP
ncbi:hypothetical protein M3Y98_01215100 [Aphelenchoides besseyi]|nr:hypothetical protein M3Y98_01215100 [Aphelenchoides besseyi]